LGHPTATGLRHPNNRISDSKTPTNCYKTPDNHFAKPPAAQRPRNPARSPRHIINLAGTGSRSGFEECHSVNHCGRLFPQRHASRRQRDAASLVKTPAQSPRANVRIPDAQRQPLNTIRAVNEVVTTHQSSTTKSEIPLQISRQIVQQPADRRFLLRLEGR
jgi:hypothetical protein